MEHKLTLQCFQRDSGQAVQNVQLFRKAWAEFEELQVQSEEIWVGRALYALSALSRFELAVFDGFEVIGAAVLAMDMHDAHVGPCMSVYAQYVLPDYRNKGVSRSMMRKAYQITADSEAQILVYSHREGPWKYSNTYRRVHANRKD